MLAGLEIWRDDVNAKGGLLGRPVELVYYDDQAAPANAPGIYAKLMSVDKVDLLIGPYSTNVIAAALPAIIQANRTTIGIFGLGANNAFKYPRYFSMNSQGRARATIRAASSSSPPGCSRSSRASRWSAPTSNSRATRSTARARTPRRSASRSSSTAAYPVGSTEFTAIVRAMQATNPDVVFAATLPPDTVGLVRAANEVQFKPKLFGGALLGLLVTGIKQQLGPLINGYVNNEFYIPAPSLQFTGTKEFLDRVPEARARARHRSARLHLSALCLCGRANSRQGRHRDQVARRREARRLHRARTPSTRSSARSRSVRTASG